MTADRDDVLHLSVQVTLPATVGVHLAHLLREEVPLAPERIASIIKDYLENEWVSLLAERYRRKA